MKELVIISGKGGTGKTSIVASFAALAEKKVIVDCDVDAADLHLIMTPDIKHREDFTGGKRAVINEDMCTQCGACISLCRFGAISDEYRVKPLICEGCGVCAEFCPTFAVTMADKVSGQWFISDTRYGPLVHARLGIAEGNSGKLVSLVKNEAKKIVEQQGLETIIIDGSPGIGCPVIASIAGSHVVLVVTEPTVSGIHDLKRVIDLTAHFRIKTLVCVNKCDLNKDNTEKIKTICRDAGIEVVAAIPYDNDFTMAQLRATSIVEYSDGQAAREVCGLWDRVYHELQ